MKKRLTILATLATLAVLLALPARALSSSEGSFTRSLQVDGEKPLELRIGLRKTSQIASVVGEPDLRIAHLHERERLVCAADGLMAAACDGQGSQNEDINMQTPVAVKPCEFGMPGAVHLQKHSLFPSPKGKRHVCSLAEQVPLPGGLNFARSAPEPRAQSEPTAAARHRLGFGK